jgi:hypothetical protein
MAPWIGPGALIQPVSLLTEVKRVRPRIHHPIGVNRGIVNPA